METLLREYQDGEQLMQEFEVTTASGKVHIVRKPVFVMVIEPQEPQETVEEKLARMEDTINLILLKQEGIL